MTEVSSHDEWQRLSELYTQKSDDELRELHDDFSDLVETAQTVLRDEMRRRGIWESEPPPAAVKGPDTPEAESDVAEQETGFDNEDLREGGITIHECNDEQEEALCRYVLERAKIPCAIVPGGSDRFALRYGQVKVAPDDVERAKAVLEQPVSPAVMREFEAQYKAEQEAGEFEVPACKKCGSTDVVLEGVDPVNQWQCGSCGAEWQDAPEGEPIPS